MNGVATTKNVITALASKVALATNNSLPQPTICHNNMAVVASVAMKSLVAATGTTAHYYSNIAVTIYEKQWL